MRIKRKDRDVFSLEVGEDELLILMGCVRETFAYLDRREFSARLGASFEDVSAMARELKECIDQEGVDL